MDIHIVDFLIEYYSDIYILVRILLGAWPTYMPHIGLLISTVLLLGQYSINKIQI